MWKYLSNQFANAVDRNYKKAFIISNYHNAALLKAKTAIPTDTDVELMYNRYNPLAQNLAAEYANWKNLGGIKQANTLNLDQLLETLTTKLNVWEPAIQSKFIKTTPEYKAILPNGRSGLTKGSKDEKVTALKNLGTSLVGITELAAIKTQIDSFYNQVEQARTTQLGSKSAKGKGADALSKAVDDCMIMQYRNLGLLMNKHALQPQIIEAYFDLATLQQTNQTTFTGTLDPSENEAVLVHTFTEGDELRLKIIGNAPARFYLSNTPNGINSETVQVAANTQLVTDVAEFAAPNYSTYRYLTALNNSTTETLRYEVEVL
ncbi:MAG: hypothetical protein ACOVNR_11270 [Chitinophagaceae bacterium]